MTYSINDLATPLPEAVANAIAVTDEVRPSPPARDEAARALATSFKEARSVLDELERVQEEALADMEGRRDKRNATKE